MMRRTKLFFSAPVLMIILMLAACSGASAPAPHAGSPGNQGGNAGPGPGAAPPAGGPGAVPVGGAGPGAAPAGDPGAAGAGAGAEGQEVIEWSGYNFAFVSNREGADEGLSDNLYFSSEGMVSEEGLTRVRKLTNNVRDRGGVRFSNPRFNDDGSKLAFSEYDGDDADTPFKIQFGNFDLIAEAAIDVTALTRPDSGEPIYATSPNWEPSGRRLAFIESRLHEAPGRRWIEFSGSVMDPIGEDGPQGVLPEGRETLGSFIWNPQWYARFFDEGIEDGVQFFFTKKESGKTSEIWVRGNSDIFEDEDGNRTVTKQLFGSGDDDADYFDLAISPDGNLLAFVMRQEIMERRVETLIVCRINYQYTQDGDFEDVTCKWPVPILVNTALKNSRSRSPSWTPDGKYLLFDAEVDGNRDIYMVDVGDPSEAVRLTTHPAEDKSPVAYPVM